MDLPDYLDPDSILTDAQLVPCFISPTQGPASTVLSHYLSSRAHISPFTLPSKSSQQGLPEKNQGNHGHVLELWVAEPWHNLGTLTIEFPKEFRNITRNALDADPCAVNLGELNPQYYKLALRLIKMKNDGALAKQLKATYISRMAQMFLESRVTEMEFRERETIVRMRKESIGDFLDDYEKRVFSACRADAEDTLKWDMQDGSEWW